MKQCIIWTNECESFPNKFVIHWSLNISRYTCSYYLHSWQTWILSLFLSSIQQTTTKLCANSQCSNYDEQNHTNSWSTTLASLFQNWFSSSKMKVYLSYCRVYQRSNFIFQLGRTRSRSPKRWKNITKRTTDFLLHLINNACSKLDKNSRYHRHRAAVAHLGQ